MTTDTFHAERLQGLGGSDLGAIMGLSPYRTPWDVWQEKTGRTPPFEGNLATRFGTFAEDFVATEYTQQTGRKVQRYNGMLRHPDAPIIGHVDRLVVPDGAKIASHKGVIRTDLGLEAKTVGAFALKHGEWGEAGTDEVPPSYLIQCQAYMLLTGCPRWDLAALIGGNADFRIYHLAADPELHDMLLEEASRWWRNHVVADQPPEPRTEAEARQRWAAHHPHRVVEVDAVTHQRMRDIARLSSEIKALEANRQALRDLVIPQLEDADTITHGGEQIATFRANKASKRTDWRRIAEEELMHMDDEERQQIIDQHTKRTPGARVLRLTKALATAA